MRTIRMLVLALLLPAGLSAQVTVDSVRAEAVRSRAFIRAAETQLSKVLELLDALDGATTPAPDPTPNPEPTPDPPAAGVLFQSDWSTATGRSSAALLDGGKWDAEKGDGDGGAVVTSVDWPDGIRNALTISHVSGNDNPGVRLDGSLPPFTSGTRAYRVYFENVLPAGHTTDGTNHAMQDGIGGSNTNWEFNVRNVSATRWTPMISLGGTCADCGGVQYRAWSLAEGCMVGAECSLPKDSVYRFEWLLTRHPTADSVDIEIRLYNADGTLRAGPEDWKRVNGGGTSADVVWYSFRNFSSTDDLQIGTNGWGGGQTSSPYVTWHWGAVAVCTDWCGPYRGGR